MRRLAVLVLLAAALVLGRSPSLAGACSCVESDPGEELRRSEVVFTGTVVTSEPRSAPGSPGFDNTVDHTVEVERVYKGDLAAEITVIGVQDTSSCGYAFEPGRYLVYGEEDEEGHVTTSLCSATTALDPGDPVPTVLGDGHPPTPTSGDEPGGPPGDEGDAAASPTTWPPIGSPDGDVVEPGTWDTFGPALLVVGAAAVAAVALVLVLRSRRRPA